MLLLHWFDFQQELENCKWLREVYERKMWAYVSDYVRCKVLYEHGGVYLDTDVTLEKDLTPLLEEHYEDIMSGSFRKSLMKHSPYAKEYEEVSEFSVQQIYSHESVIRVEVTGFNVIKKLMELYLQWVDNPASPLSKKIACILHADKARLDDPGYRFAHVIDYVSGMTDSYALKTYTDLFGHAPGM